MLTSAQYRIGKGLKVQFEFDEAGAMRAHWLPSMPKTLKGAWLARYRRARDDFMVTVADQTGARIGVTDLPACSDGPHLSVIEPPVRH